MSSAKIVCGAMVVVAVAWSGRAGADCAELDKDGAAWASKLIVRGAMAVIDCETCSAEPVRIKKVEVRKSTIDASMRSLWIDGRELDLSIVYVQTGAETFTNVGALIGCTGPSDQMVRRVYKDLSTISTGVPECDRYLVTMKKYTQCSAIPQASKDAMRQAVDQMKQGWQMLRDPSVSPDARKAAGDACRESAEALTQAAQALGCPL
jgi:hypothetical protein